MSEYWITDFDITSKNIIMIALSKKSKNNQVLFNKGCILQKFIQRSTFLKNIKMEGMSKQLETLKALKSSQESTNNPKNLNLESVKHLSSSNSIVVTKRTLPTTNLSQPTINTKNSRINTEGSDNSKYKIKIYPELPNIPIKMKSTRNQKNIFQVENFLSARNYEIYEKPAIESPVFFENARKFWNGLINQYATEDIFDLKENQGELELELKDVDISQIFMTKEELDKSLKLSQVYQQFTSDLKNNIEDLNMRDIMANFFKVSGEQAKTQYLEILKKGKGKELFTEIVKYLLIQTEPLSEEQIKKRVNKKKIKKSNEMKNLIKKANKEVNEIKKHNKIYEEEINKFINNIDDQLINYEEKKKYDEKNFSKKAILSEFKQRFNLKPKKLPIIEENIKKIKSYKEDKRKRFIQKKTKNTFRRINARIKSNRIKNSLDQRRRENYMNSLQNFIERKIKIKLEKRIAVDWKTIEIYFCMMSFASKLKNIINMGNFFIKPKDI